MLKRIGISLLTIAMTFSVLLPNLPFANILAIEKLVNIAPDGTATTTSVTASGEITNLNDEDDTTVWQTSSWPSQAVIQLDGGHNVKKVSVKLGENSANENVNITVTYAQNSVTSDLIAFASATGTPGSNVDIEVSTPVSATHIYVSIEDSNGASSGQTLSIKEIEVYELIDVELSAYNNIAAQSIITATGNKEHASEGSANLVDKNASSLYKFYDGQMTSEQSILLSYEVARTMDAFRIAFEKVTSDQYSYQFNFSIVAQNSATDGDNWDTIASNVICNRTDASSKEFQITAKTYDRVKIIMHSCTTNSGNGWPAIAEFEVYGSEVVVEDKDAVSNGKPVHVPNNNSTASNIVDGSKSTLWRGAYYPAYADIDLEANYDLSAVEVYTPEDGYSQYSIYTSLNGRDFDKLAEKTSKTVATLANGEVYDATGTTARYVRIYLEYNSATTNAVINEVRVLGKKSSVPAQAYPTLNVPNFAGSAYDVEISANDTYEEIYGIIDRRLGETYRDWFSFELAENTVNDYDYFEISALNGKVHIKGNEGVSITMGINHYLKNFCNVHVSQVGDQVNMPDSIVLPTETVRQETKAKVRYAYNYCTLSYSMAFYGENEWREELDWLALNGANVVLDATAQEEVWRRFLGKLGYDHASAKDYIAGPAYYAWAYMANLSGFGGPVHDSWFVERTELARKNQLSMRKLGMQPCLQGYSGMVPTDIQSYDSAAPIISQGSWCSFQRPAMLVTTDAKFDEYASLFYECQKEVYGNNAHYYATDPFHEGGNTGGMNATDISREVLTSMLAADANAVWIIQAWQGNPTTALLNGLDQIENGAQHALVLDLYAEKTPHNTETGSSYGDTDEFDDTPWVYCMLNNFGGRLGLHGHLDTMATKIPEAFNTGDYIAGVGITPEASVNNPVLYDFLFESCWVDDASATMKTIDLTSWLKAYATRRYGAQSDNADAAWMILKDTVYKASLNMNGQGSPESIVNARPALSINAASTWGNAIISYDKLLLEEALELLLEDYEQFQGNEAYMYDIANVEQQVLSNSAQEVHGRMAAAFNARNLEEFSKEADTFMEIIDRMEEVTATTEYFMLGRWVEMAKALAANADDFTKDLYEFNAKAIVTTWGSKNQAETGRLKDYSNRQWSGLIGDFYRARWQRWIDARKAELAGQSYESSIDWFEWEWEWVRDDEVYPNTPTPQNLKTLGNVILENYSSINPAADDSKDIAKEHITVTTGSYEPNNATEGDPNYVLDGNTGTIWHTDWDGSEREFHYLTFTFDAVTEIDSMRYLPRNGGNGLVTTFSLYYRNSEDAAWIPLIENRSASTTYAWQQYEFDPIQAKEIKFKVENANSSNSLKFAAVTEMRFTQAETSVATDKTSLNTNILDCADEIAAVDTYTTISYNAFKTAYDNAVNVNNNANATVAEVNTAQDYLLYTLNNLQLKDTTAPTISANVEARYSSNRIYWDAVDGATGYKVLRSTTQDGTFVELTSSAFTATEYIDENATTGTMYYYVVQVIKDGNTYDSEVVNDTYVPGMEAIHEHAKAQFHKDYTDNTSFDGSRVETMSAEETKIVSNMDKGTILLVVKPNGTNSGSRQIIWNIKNSSTTTTTGNNADGNPANNLSFFIYNTTTVRYDYGYALKSPFTGSSNTNAWNAIGLTNTYYSSGNNIVHSLNGNTAGGYGNTQWDGFLNNSNISGDLDKMYIGGSVNGSSNVATFYGDIAYVTVTDEVLSTEELNEYTRDVAAYLNELDALNASKAALNEAITNAQPIITTGNNPQVYTTDTWTTFETAYNNAVTVNNNANATKTEIDAATTALTTAQTNLAQYVASTTKVLNLVATPLNYKTITLTWDAVTDAESYTVYRQNTKTNEWIRLSTTNETTFTVNGVKTGKQYSYKVHATVGGEACEDSDIATAATTLTGTQTLTLEMNGDTAFDLTWTTIEGATRYIVYRKSDTAEWKKILTLGKDVTTYTSKSMQPNNYTYQVKAARYDSVDRVMHEGSNEVVGTSSFTTPVVTLTPVESNALQLAWEAIEGAQYYEVWRDVDNSGTYRRFRVTKETTLTNKSLSSAKTYSYKVRAYRVHNGNPVYSAYSEAQSYTIQ